MSEKIYRNLSTDFIRRMRNWRDSKTGVGESTISSAYDGGGFGGLRDMAPIVLEGEAIDTEACLERVTIRYRQAVKHFWIYEGEPLRWHARQLKLGLFHLTFEAWVIKGHEELRPLLYAKSAAYHRSKAERSLIAYLT